MMKLPFDDRSDHGSTQNAARFVKLSERAAAARS
jgi:hypothetical protein